MLKNFIKAARLRTLPLSVSGIIVGSSLANFKVFNHPKNFNIVECFGCLHYQENYIIFALAILTTIGFQVLSNFANDYGDGIKGTDDNREGEERLVASGAVTPQQMKTAMIVTVILTLIIALLLIYVSFGKENFQYSVIFFLLGVASIVAAIKYTVGNSAYGYSGFGDIFVFLFFGLLSVCGSYFLYTKQLNLSIFLPAISVGLLSTAVLNLNNMRDRVSDEKANKNTLVVKMGAQKSKKYHYALLIMALLCSIVFVIQNYKSESQFLFLIAFIPICIHLYTVFKNKEPKLLDKELKKLALSTFLFAILFAIGHTL